jgi:hypothetical protein
MSQYSIFTKISLALQTTEKIGKHTTIFGNIDKKCVKIDIVTVVKSLIA